jgi:2-succinyl-5-enolpyruvyl-6-hydroxy-3-cyclohexene-1-carboxylate synthase
MTSHLHVQLIADYLSKREIHHVVISPGSRSAPFVIALNEYPRIRKYAIADERVAGYFALGIAQQVREPVVVICTSGTAVLNLAPAVCEAFYQALPLIAITADRPQDCINNGENQTIFQREVFKNFVERSLVFEPIQSLHEFTRLLPDMDECIQERNAQPPGPSHWNVHIPEPLYERAGEEIPFYELPQTERSSPTSEFETDEAALDFLSRIGLDLDKIFTNQLYSEWQQAKKIMIVSGYEYYSPNELFLLKEILTRQQVVCLSEHASNIPFHHSAHYHTDAMLSLIPPQHENKFAPDVVITIGRQILSKKLKQFLRKNKPQYYFHLSPHGDVWNQFFVTDESFGFAIESYESFFSGLPFAAYADADFKMRWESLRRKAHELTEHFCQKIPFSDLKVYKTILTHLPQGTNLQLGNSTPVRYAQFFPLPPHTRVNANRGTSGIDGCLSTAAGAAAVNQRLTVSIVGDISFFYDSNALWNRYLSPQLRIILINNGGGNIFRLIEGPDTVKGFEDFFETRHQLSAKYLAEMFDLPYYFCKTHKQLEEVLPDFFRPQKKASILEIKTNNLSSAAVYRQYFAFLKQQNPQA